MIESPKQAFEILEKQEEGIPWEAIKYLRAQKGSKEVQKRVIWALDHAYGDTFVIDDFYLPTPIWYAIVAEEFICEALIQPVFDLFTTTADDDWDFLNEQGMFLVGKLAQKYPNKVIPVFTKTVDGLMSKNSKLPYLYLFEVIYYMDLEDERQKSWILKNLKKRGYWEDSFVNHVADIQFKEAIPIIESIISEIDPNNHSIREYRFALEQLKKGKAEYPHLSRPYPEKRGDWEAHYKGLEHRFYDQDDEPFEGDFDKDAYWEEKMRTPIRVEKVGRNEPCPCGSGKKYKKCCIE